MGEGKGETFVPPKSCGYEVDWFLKKLSPQNKKDLKQLNIFDLKGRVEARGHCVKQEGNIKYQGGKS